MHPFTRNAATRDFYTANVVSGGAAVNEPILHIAQRDLPFCGVGL